ncbi:MAG: hypothetical protein WBJ82_10470 [Tepidanaerobacteraceae bacterium]
MSNNIISNEEFYQIKGLDVLRQNVHNAANQLCPIQYSAHNAAQN